MEKYYQNDAHNAAFERCIDVLSRLIVKYGSSVIGEHGNQQATCHEEQSSECGETCVHILPLPTPIYTVFAIFIWVMTFGRRNDKI